MLISKNLVVFRVIVKDFQIIRIEFFTDHKTFPFFCRYPKHTIFPQHEFFFIRVPNRFSRTIFQPAAHDAGHKDDGQNVALDDNPVPLLRLQAFHRIFQVPGSDFENFR